MNTLTLIGVGLIGGSFALDLKRQGLISHIFGIDIDTENLDRALERNVIDSAMTHINKEAANADIIMLATPVVCMNEIIANLAPIIGKHTILIDVGSTKQKTLNAFCTHLPHHLPHCVAAHPIAGSERSGALAARFGLFADKKVILCPHPQQNTGSLNTIHQLWQQVGAQVYQMSAQEHDAIFSAVSHLPHLLAYAFMNHIQHHPKTDTLLHFAASGFRDFTRIAGSHPDIWADVCLANSEHLETHLQQYIAELNHLAKTIHQRDRQALHQLFSEAKTLRDQWQETQ